MSASAWSPDRLADGDGAAATTADAAAFADPLLSLEAPAKDEVIVDEPSPAAQVRRDPHPRRRAHQRRLRPRRPLRRPARRPRRRPAAPPRAPSFAHVGESATGFVPEPAAEPMYSGYAGRVTTQLAEADIDTNTGPAWVMTLIPVYALMAGLLLLLSGISVKPTALAIGAALRRPARRRHRARRSSTTALLQAPRHGSKPATWVWGDPRRPVLPDRPPDQDRPHLAVRASARSSPCSRSVPSRSVRPSRLPASIIQLNPGYFSVEAQQSVRSDAEILGAELVVNCPDTPPLLIGQSFQCSATNENQEFFNVTVSLQRANGWIEWRVDNWGIYSIELTLATDSFYPRSRHTPTGVMTLAAPASKLTTTDPKGEACDDRTDDPRGSRGLVPGPRRRRQGALVERHHLDRARRVEARRRRRCRRRSPRHRERPSHRPRRRGSASSSASTASAPRTDAMSRRASLDLDHRGPDTGTIPIQGVAPRARPRQDRHRLGVAARVHAAHHDRARGRRRLRLLLRHADARWSPPSPSCCIVLGFLWAVGDSRTLQTRGLPAPSPLLALALPLVGPLLYLIVRRAQGRRQRARSSPSSPCCCSRSALPVALGLDRRGAERHQGARGAAAPSAPTWSAAARRPASAARRSLESTAAGTVFTCDAVLARRRHRARLGQLRRRRRQLQLGTREPLVRIRHPPVCESLCS